MSAPRAETPRGSWLRLALYVGFVVYGLIRFRAAPGDDLSASYFGCRLLASGGAASLYDYDPTIFSEVNTRAWRDVAAAAHFQGALHPYVQTPLWAWSLSPLCLTLGFDAFRFVFLAAALVSIAALVELTARAWAPKFLNPTWTFVLLFALSLTTPLAYSMWLAQTHALFLALTVAALVAADRDRPALAGLALALAAAVKITPGLLLVYWLFKGQRRAAAWFVGVSALLMAATALAVCLDVTSAYLDSMRRVSDVLLLAYNNQSFAAWQAYSPDLVFHLTRWRILPLSPTLKVVSLSASLIGVAFAGWQARGRSAGAPAAFALLVVTVFSPIAWTHYYIALTPAAMVLMQSGAAIEIAALVAILSLNVPPLAVDPQNPVFGALTIVRSQLLAGALAMGALLWGRLNAGRRSNSES